MQNNHTNKIVSLVKILMKKDVNLIDEINSKLFETWEVKKNYLKKSNLLVEDLFENSSEMVMYYLRSVLTFNIKKTSLA